jgi:hypothetical protein
MANPYQGDDVDYFNAARDKEGNIDKKKAAPLVKAAAESADSIPRFPTKPKNRVVTKEELKKSGLSLRDFLNKERGLKRRDGKKPNTQNDMSDKDRLRAQLDSAKESSQAGRYGTMKRGGVVKSSAPKMGKVKTAKPSMGGASKRADGIAKKGKTRGRMV